MVPAHAAVSVPQFVCNLPYSPATDLSAMERWYGALAIHASGAGGGTTPRLRAFVLPATSTAAADAAALKQQQQQQRAGGVEAATAATAAGGGGGGAAVGLLPPPPAPVPCSNAAYADTERGAANR